MEPEAYLDAFAREQRAGLGALARLSRPGDWDPPEPAGWDQSWNPRESGDWDPSLARRWADDDPPSAVRPYIPDVSQRSPARWR